MENMNKRILIAILLSVIVLVAYPFIVPAPKTPKQEMPQSQELEQTAGQKEGKLLSEAEVVQDTGEMGKEERLITIDTDLYKAIFTNKGGVIKRWELKKYWMAATQKKSIVLFDPGKVIVAANPLGISVGEGELNNLVKEGL